MALAPAVFLKQVVLLLEVRATSAAHEQSAAVVVCLNTAIYTLHHCTAITTTAVHNNHLVSAHLYSRLCLIRKALSFERLFG
jgi:hypothetical protein